MQAVPCGKEGGSSKALALTKSDQGADKDTRQAVEGGSKQRASMVGSDGYGIRGELVARFSSLS